VADLFEDDAARAALARSLGKQRVGDLGAAYRAIDDFMNVAHSLGAVSGEGLSQAMLGAQRLNKRDLAGT
jgi:hypothetical protein